MATHIKSFNIDSFRGITELKLNNLSDINILVGNNNCGKTSVLEALMLIHKPYSFNNVIRTAIKREVRIRPVFRSYLSNYEIFTYLFNKLDKYNKISISTIINDININWSILGEFNNILIDDASLDLIQNTYHSNPENDNIIEDEIEEFEGELICSIRNMYKHISNSDFDTCPEHQNIRFNKYSRIRPDRTLDNSLINMQYISSSNYLLDTSFRSIIKDSEITNEVIDLLHTFDEDIINLKIIESDERRYIQVIEHKSLGLMPLSLYGDGLKKVITLANSIVQSKNGILLIDEVETGIHVSAMNRVFSWLVTACKKFNIQLFITTHSLETLDQFLLCDKEIISSDSVRVVTLVKKHSNTIARILSGEKALKARNNYDMELR